MTPESDDPVERLKAQLRDADKAHAKTLFEFHEMKAGAEDAEKRVKEQAARAEEVIQRLGSEMSARSQAQAERYQLAQRVKELEAALADAKAHVAHLTEALERRGEILFGQQGD